MSGKLAAWLLLVGALTAAAYGARAASGKPPRDAVYQYGLAVGGVIQYALVLAVVLAIARGPATSALLALRRPISWRRALGIAFGVLVAINLLGYVLDPLLHPGREQGLTPTGWDPSRAGAFAVNFVVIAGLAPVVEELTFRGVGFALLQRFGRPLAIVVVGLAFGFSHGLVQALPILVAFGVGLGYLRSRTESVYPPMILHGAFNAIALIASVST